MSDPFGHIPDEIASLRARLVEVERREHALIDELTELNETASASVLAASARALQAEGAARTLREIVDVWKYIHGVAKGRRMWVLGWEIWLGIIANANAVLSGLPPLTSETAEPMAARMAVLEKLLSGVTMIQCDGCDRPVSVEWGPNGLRMIAPHVKHGVHGYVDPCPGSKLILLPTPAALVPKEEA